MSTNESTWTLPIPDTALHVSAIRTTDVPELIGALNDRVIYRGTLRIPFPYEEQHATTYLEIVAETTRQHGHPRQYAIRTSDDRLIGCVGLEGDVGSHQAEVGYWLARPFRGKGLMPRVVSAICEYGMEELALVRITAHVFAFNEPSMRVLEKCGFELEGHLRKKYAKDGKYIDAKLYALVK